eukprot:1158382-Pelagomonas_calceolata.AAC.6
MSTQGQQIVEAHNSVSHCTPNHAVLDTASRYACNCAAVPDADAEAAGGFQGASLAAAAKGSPSARAMLLAEVRMVATEVVCWGAG